MRLLIMGEYSGIERDAFLARGVDAVSCDLLPTERPGPHYQGDVRDILGDGWDGMIAHPPCDHLAVCGARWFAQKYAEQQRALSFVRMLMLAPIPRICIENPVGVISSQIRKPSQIIQPHQFGHGETKATCLWLFGFPPLWPTRLVTGREPRIHFMPPSPTRAKERARAYHGIAEAMADQWSRLLLDQAA